MEVLCIIAWCIFAAGAITLIVGLFTGCNPVSIVGAIAIGLMIIAGMTLANIGAPERSLEDCTESNNCTATVVQAYQFCNTLSGNCEVIEKYNPEVLPDGTVVLPKRK